MDRDGEIEKRKTVVGNFMGEFDGWMESGHKLYEADEIFSGAGGNAEAVIYETTKEEGHGSSVLEALEAHSMESVAWSASRLLPVITRLPAKVRTPYVASRPSARASVA